MRQFPTTSQDWFYHIAQGVASNALIQYVIKFDQLLEYEVLMQTVYDSITAEPILGCKSSIKEPHPIWIQSNINIDDVCSFKKTDNMNQEINFVFYERIKCYGTNTTACISNN